MGIFEIVYILQKHDTEKLYIIYYFNNIDYTKLKLYKIIQLE